MNTLDTITRLISIVPIDFNEYSRLMSKPYKQPLKSQGWRLLHAGAVSGQVAEIIVKSGSTLTDYTLRYVRRPNPIILTNLSDTYSNVSIDGITAVTECELDPILHPEILQRSVELAKAAYTGDIKSSVELGNRSE